MSRSFFTTFVRQTMVAVARHEADGEGAGRDQHNGRRAGTFQREACLSVQMKNDSESDKWPAAKQWTECQVRKSACLFILLGQFSNGKCP